MNGLKRFLVIFITTAICFLLQVVLLPKIPHLITVPNLLLVETVSIGFLYGKSLGLWTGVICGLLLDILCVGVPGFYTLILSVLGYGNGLLSEKMESELILVLLLLFLVNEILLNGYVFIFSFLIRRSFSLGSYITEIFIPEFLLTFVFFIVIYGILKFICNRLDLKVNKGEVKVV